ncbi:YwmB family TATA-box binding protein [Tissierella carlieri]|uniref:YwmB family TATA-box binding protein n=1 Tax=Tissierella TaxID=41273 RepID=UPI001C10A251|nr:YwmB family TATA-box binding protein [Tissierella carlieri]
MKKFILFAIILSLLIPTITMAGKKHSEKDVLEGILKDLNGEFFEGDLNMGGVLIDEFISRETMEELGELVKESLGIVGEEIDINRDITDVEGQFYCKEIIYEKGFNQMSIYGYDANINPITIVLASYLNPELNNGETTLFINLIKREQNFSINGIIEKIESIFKDYGKPLEITTCIIGTIEGKSREEDLTKNAVKAMRRFKAKVVEEYTDISLVSYTAYTPLIESSIFSGEKKVNLNLAIRYNENEDKTYIWIGTPIITTGY